MDFPRSPVPPHRRVAERLRRLAGDWQIAACVAAAVLACFAVAVILAARSVALPVEADGARGDAGTEPRYTAGGELLRPRGVDRWVFVGASLGLGYGDTGTGGEALFFHNVYIAPAAYDAFVRTGAFPERTMLALTIHRSDGGAAPASRGRYEGPAAGFEVAVKDSGRFPGGWAYFGFGPGRASAARSGPDCLACHAAHAATDHVFTQFYPVLRDRGPR
ncbi:MAG TPA: cytochrome P460 family protein [Vicinamibacterales bacterium]|nr:cytochrome P460 family protein [Vicinamibacterales bacterium]